MIKIDLLKNHPHAIPALANIWHEVLGKIWMPNLTIQYIQKQLVGSWTNEDKLPLAYVALIEDKIVGAASLQVECDLGSDLTPWLGSLVIDPIYQKQGIGKMLVDTTKNKAIELGFRKLYLFAFDPTIPEYYERLGWQKIGMDEFKSHPVTVMAVGL